ncbi:Uncharacterised protein [Vibrio cholerae]|nr:Uncharacterised protein [Vibrio cholerae]CSI29146.1 Uncharacterised protein [Vibrio cholerae]
MSERIFSRPCSTERKAGDKVSQHAAALFLESDTVCG